MELIINQCKASSANFKSIDDWKSANLTDYLLAKSVNVLLIVCEHMKSKKWNEDTCIESALPYELFTEWKRKNFAAHRKAVELNILDKCKSHMRSRLKWDEAACIQEACRFKTPSEWQNKSPSSYLSALHNKWKDKCLVAMGYLRQEAPDSKTLINDAKQYRTVAEWKAANKFFWKTARDCVDTYVKCIAHMEGARIPAEYWNELRLIKSAKPFSIRSKWKECEPSAYLHAKKDPIIFNKCVAHMITPSAKKAMAA